jgi:hypothetical protein
MRVGAYRRTFLRLVITAGVAAAIQGLRPVSVECAEGEVQIEWYVPDDEVEEVGKVAPPGIEHKRAVGPAETRGPAAAVLVGVVPITVLAESIAKVHMKLKFGGVLIVAKDVRVIIVHDRTLDNGKVEVKDRNGTTIKSMSRNRVDAAELAKALESFGPDKKGP